MLQLFELSEDGVGRGEGVVILGRCECLIGKKGRVCANVNFVDESKCALSAYVCSGSFCFVFVATGSI